MKKGCNKTCVYFEDQEWEGDFTCHFEDHNPDKEYCTPQNNYINYQKKVEVPKNFDVNVFEIIADALDSHIKTGANIIGSSGISMCMRSKIIELILKKKGIDIPFEPNSKMLFGEIFEDVLYLPKVLSLLIININEKLGLENEDMRIAPQSQKFIDIETGESFENADDSNRNYFRVTPDIPVFPYYMVEVKTTAIYAREWKRELASHQVVQLNSQLGAFGLDLGFILKVNSRAFIAGISKLKEDETYWEKLWNSYGYLLPWHFDLDMYNKTLERVRDIFTHAENEDFNVDGPEMSWECGYCPEIKRKICGKEEYKCSAPKCQKTFYEHPDKLTEKFKSFPLCYTCFKKENPRHKYDKYKFGVSK